MTQQTAIQIGNSTGVVIPANFRREMGVRTGSKLSVEMTSDKKLLISNSESKQKASSVTPEFKNWLEGFNKEYGRTLQALANK